MKYLVGIDIGTSATKSVLFDENGTVIASVSYEYPLYQPKNGYAEQDPEDWWTGVKSTLKEIAPKATDGSIVGVGLSGQMHSLVLLDEKNEVIRPAILWCDQRCAKECEEIEEAMGGRDRLVAISANPALPGFTAGKLMWVKKHERENFDRCAHILLPKDYIRFKLTGEYATEVSDASGMQLLDVAGRVWSIEICEKLGVDMKKLPKLYESADATGYITEEAAVLTGLDAGTVVAGGGGDNAASAVGTGVCSDGKAFTTVGTSGVVFAHTKEPIVDFKGRIHTFCAAVRGEWHVMGVTQAAGLSLNWFKNNLAKDKTYPELDIEAAKIPLGSDKLLYLPYLMGERTPILDSDARGVFFGLSAVHTQAHMARAVMEGVCYSLYSCLDVFSELNIKLDSMAMCGGGAKSGFWLEMFTDVFGINLHTMKLADSATLGAAILGGCAAGVYKDVKEGVERAVKIDKSTAPDNKKHEKYMQYYKLYTGLYLSVKDMYKRLSAI